MSVLYSNILVDGMRLAYFIVSVFSAVYIEARGSLCGASSARI